MSTPLSFAQAEFIGLILHSMLFGGYIGLFIRCLPFEGDIGGIRSKFASCNKVLFVTNVLLFFFISSHWIVQIIRAMNAFFGSVDGTEETASVYYALAAAPLNLTKEALYLTQTFIGDLTMVFQIYRLWIVYNRNYMIIIVPSLVLTGFAISAVAVVVALARVTPAEDIFSSTAGRWAITVFITTVGANIVVTALITWKVLTVKKRLQGVAIGTGVMGVIHIIIESASLYTICAICTLVGYSTKQTWQFITIDMISPIIGISFTLISVRVTAQANSSRGMYSDTGKVSNSGQGHRLQVLGGRDHNNRRGEQIGFETLSVNVTQQVTKHMDGDIESEDYGSQERVKGIPLSLEI